MSGRSGARISTGSCRPKGDVHLFRRAEIYGRRYTAIEAFNYHCTDNEFTPDSHILAVGVLRGCEIILMEVTQDAGDIDTRVQARGWETLNASATD